MPTLENLKSFIILILVFCMLVMLAVMQHQEAAKAECLAKIAEQNDYTSFLKKQSDENKKKFANIEIEASQQLDQAIKLTDKMLLQNPPPGCEQASQWALLHALKAKGT